ncbi:chemotaxis protein CheA [Qipengyuania nanhaisediminis]|uniref:Chemotaxis protein CheA n=1 Tax=Qipengyuania nanhaisediminis TaxID=604088 RepID=A0A1I5LIJ4_9SPHN|nr:chemotaxis protein CheA [Qipengyuania nanhaisediminis]SFO97120.1 two-component system, chemotaxis family, sensor kinase CheA [Qipengyuania nanhaisediminis]
MDELLAEFIAETREMLEQSGTELVAWEADPSDRARIDTIFRFVHTVKGNCGFFDFPLLEKLSHAAEDALAECRAGRREADPALVTAVLAIIDRIGNLADLIEAGEELVEDQNDAALIAALEADAAIEVQSDVTPVAPAADEEDGAAPVAAKRNAVQRSIRLPVDLLDEVMKGVSDMVLARNDLARRLREAGEQPTIDGPFERLSAILADVRTSITRMRMQRLEHLFTSLPRLVRDLSSELGKQVMVDFEGGEVELDREMIEMIRDPLTHIIRNAIDHGVETPAERLKKGKREIGLLRFAARQSGNQISLIITDDGGGIDTGRLSQKAVAAGIYSQAEIDSMSQAQKHQLIFEPGLSTADEVSAVSGRGVGMDVVRANLERVGGSITVSSKPGEGTSFHLHLPLTLSIIATLTVSSGGQNYAIPRNYIEEIVFGSANSVEFAQAGARRLITFRGRRVPCLSLADVLGTEDNERCEWETKTLVLVRLASDDVFALAVDRVHDHEDVVVKPIAPAIMQTKLYAGTTLLDDGTPMMLIDLPSIAQMRGLVGEMRSKPALVEETSDKQVKTAVPLMLFAGLDGRRRAVRLELVRRIDTVSSEAFDIDGTRAQAVINGRILPLAGLEHGSLPEGRCRLLRLSDGESEVVYAVSEVLDAAEMTGDLVVSGDDPTIEGVTLIEGKPVPLIDGHTLFFHYATPRPIAHPLTCRIPRDNDWARTILEPLVEAAGYRIAAEGDDEADLAIHMAGDVVDAGQARETIRLRPDPEDAGDGSIYRYDREGLLAELKRVRTGRAA